MNCRKCQADIPDGSSFCPWCGCRQVVARWSKSRGNGTGTVYKRGSTWTAKVTLGWHTVNGKSRGVFATKGGFKTKREALECLPALRGERQGKKTLAEYWEIWERDDLPKLSESKQTAYKIAYRKLGSIIYRDISKLDVSDLRRAVESGSNSYYTARDMKSLLSHLYKLAGADQVANVLLPTFIVLPDLHETEQTPFNSDELKSLWTAYEAGDIFVGYILLMIYSGMMPGELLNARKDMVDLEHQQIVGAGLKTKARKKNGIAIADFMVPVVSSLLEYSKGQKLLSMNKDTFYVRYREALERCGCRQLPPYSCRHTTATALAIGQNVAPVVIRNVMRWSTSRMLDRYAHPTPADAIGALNGLAPVINEQSTGHDEHIEK